MKDTYKALEVSAPGELRVVERQVSEPGAGQVRIRVEAKLRRLFRARGYAIGRKKLVISHPKLKEVVHRSF